MFLLTDELRLVAYTDGETGDVLVQRINSDGGPAAEPVVLGQTTRQLYDDADFHDAAISLASAEGGVVAVWVEGLNQLRAAVSSDGDATWRRQSGSTRTCTAAARDWLRMGPISSSPPPILTKGRDTYGIRSSASGTRPMAAGPSNGAPTSATWCASAGWS